MSANVAPNIVRNGLILNIDASNSKSYISGSTRWNDLTSNANAGTLINGPAFNSNNGGSIVFDGIDDYGITSTTTFTANNDFTFDLFCKSDVWDNQGGIFGNKGYYSVGQGAQITNFSNPQQVGFVILTDVTIYDIGTGIGPTYNWTNFVLRRTGNLMEGFVNGVKLATTRTISGNIVDASDKFWIGNHNGGSNGFNGNISIVKVYSRALLNSEILQNYNALKSRFGL